MTVEHPLAGVTAREFGERFVRLSRTPPMPRKRKPRHILLASIVLVPLIERPTGMTGSGLLGRWGGTLGRRFGDYPSSTYDFDFSVLVRYLVG